MTINHEMMMKEVPAMMLLIFKSINPEKMIIYHDDLRFHGDEWTALDAHLLLSNSVTLKRIY